jgi:hypothetical protein
LIRISSPEELKVYEEIIRERPELAFETNLSRNLQRGTSTLAELPQKPKDDFVRHGLSWMTALARVELGAMLAGFSSVKQPFAAMQPTPRDMAPYQELLLDGARTHYWSLNEDARLKWTIRQRVMSVYKAVLSYSRRLVMARAMLRSAHAATANYAPAQHQEMQQWKGNMDELQAVLVVMVQDVLGNRSFSQTSREDREFTRACGALLAAERREIQAGTARVESPGPDAKK